MRTPNITDRALRYRANADPPEGERVCAFCGSTRNVEVGHIDGFEEHLDPENLIWTCRSCNVRLANRLKRAGMGRRTRQYNPSKGAQSMGQWVTAVESMKGDSNAMTVKEAVELIRATPQRRRQEFAAEIWAKRRRAGSDKWARSEVPF